MKSTLNDLAVIHAAIIMDGNGRWAERRGLPRTAGHEEGCRVARRIVKHALNTGIRALTLYAFSSDNWKRPPMEVRRIMSLLREYLRTEMKACAQNGIRINMIGRRDRISNSLRAAVQCAEMATANGTGLHLRLAVDYSSKESMLRAMDRMGEHAPRTQEAFSEALSALHHPGPDCADVDLLIRTGGEQRLSDFLLWESAYAELLFTPRQWPDFQESDLDEAVAEFHRRTRRFGAVLAKAQ